MPIQLLPLLRTNNQVKTITNTGDWTNGDAGELDNISKGLKVDAIPDGKFLEVDSIPDMWARPRLFEMALLGKTQQDSTQQDNDQQTEEDNQLVFNLPMHDQILNEWRGLLAMLALKERRYFPLTIENIDISNINDNEDNRPFLQALNNLLPTETLCVKTNWNELDIILFKGKPIGITSPTTLVCTSVNYAGNLNKGDVPWFMHGQYLTDPIAYLTPEEKAVFSKWLKDLKEQIPRNNPVLRHALIELIDNYIDNLGGVQQIQTELAVDSLGFSQSLYAGMNRPIAGQEYFTEKLYVVTQDSAFPGCHIPKVPKAYTPILPIKIDKLMVDHPKIINDLQERIEFESIEKDNKLVGFKVNLTIPSTNNNDPVTTQEYHFDNQENPDHTEKKLKIVEIHTLPVIEIWPDFNKKEWNTYYTYVGRSSTPDTFLVTPYVIPMEGDSSHSSANTDSMEREFLDPSANIDVNGENQHSKDPLEVGDEKDKIIKTSDFPKVFQCKYKEKNPDLPDAPSKEEEAGILFIKDPKEKKIEDSGESEWTIGIDFGTTSTTVYRKAPVGVPLKVDFENRLIKVTKANDADRLSLYDFFFSPNEDGESTPFFSLYNAKVLKGSPIENDNKKPLLNGNIYFLPTKPEFTGPIRSNLKWSIENDADIIMQLFLEQLCLQCSAEAVANGVSNINWNYSYPLAFDPNTRKAFEKYWEDVLKACSKRTGIKFTNDNLGNKAESIVIARYFVDPSFEGRDFSGGSIFIDIGGGTSDISIWNDKSLLSQTSLKFAGRDLLLDRFKNNPNFLQQFNDRDKSINYEGISKKLAGKTLNPYQKYTQIDALLQNASESQRWLEKYDGNKDRSECFRVFRQLVGIGISGLFYYVGLMLKYHIDNEKFKSYKDTNIISVYIGGRGSRILEWFGGNDDRDNDDVDKRIRNQVLFDASGVDTQTRFDITVSENRKEEAAIGLVNNLDDNEFHFHDEENSPADFVIAGESYKTTENEVEKIHDWKDTLTADSFDTLIKTTGELKSFQNFVESFNKHTDASSKSLTPLPIEMVKDDKTDNYALCEGINAVLRGISNQKNENRHPEPIFILALKELLRNKTIGWTRITPGNN